MRHWGRCASTHAGQTDCRSLDLVALDALFCDSLPSVIPNHTLTKMRYCILSSWLALTLALFPGPGHAAEAEDYFRQGYVAYMSRDWEKAISLYTRAIEIDPDHVEARFQRAAAFDILGRTDEAISDYEATLKLRPDYYLAIEYLAKLYEGKGDYFKAVDLYSKALPLAPDPKWRSVINGWISEARKKMQAGRKDENNAMKGKSKTDRSKR